VVTYTGSLEEEMAEAELITKSSRSEGAKRMWEKRKAKEEASMIREEVPIKAWIYHGQWLTLMAAVIGCFLFVHHENVEMVERLDSHTVRLDNHIEAINRRVDDSNRRTDELHKEFYELLKEMRRNG
jgi:hypothetical protein